MPHQSSFDPSEHKQQRLREMAQRLIQECHLSREEGQQALQRSHQLLEEFLYLKIEHELIADKWHHLEKRYTMHDTSSFT